MLYVIYNFGAGTLVAGLVGVMVSMFCFDSLHCALWLSVAALFGSVTSLVAVFVEFIGEAKK